MPQPRSRKANGKNESGLPFVSHAIDPSHDDVREPIPDDSRTTIRGRAKHDGHPNRRRARATPDTPAPIPDDDGRPSPDGCHATSAHHAIRDARPNRHRGREHVQRPAQPRTEPSWRRRGRLFEVSFLNYLLKKKKT